MKKEQKVCKQCLAEFGCKLHNFSCSDCVAFGAHYSMLSFLKQTKDDCICKNCLNQWHEKFEILNGKTFPQSDELLENFHFYMDGAYFVFTENYHLLRGYCCKSGCRHCPYEFKK